MYPSQVTGSGFVSDWLKNSTCFLDWKVHTSEPIIDLENRKLKQGRNHFQQVCETDVWSILTDITTGFVKFWLSDLLILRHVWGRIFVSKTAGS